MNCRRATMSLMALCLILNAGSVHAKEGEMGYFCGTSEGVKLPTTIEYLQNKKHLVQNILFLTRKMLSDRKGFSCRRDYNY